MRRMWPLMLVVLGLASPAWAQIVEVPTFVVGVPSATGSQLTTPDVGAGIDGGMLFIWRDRRIGDEVRKAFVHQFSAAGVSLAPPLRVDENGDASDTRLEAAVSGGYVALWRQVTGARSEDARRLDATGTPVAPTFTIAPNETILRHALATLPSGTVFVWVNFSTLKARLYDTMGQPRGAAFTVGSVGSGAAPSVEATLDGGFVVVWPFEGESIGRRYDDEGVPLGAAGLLSSDFRVTDVAASPLGGFAIVGLRGDDDHARPSGVWGRRFDAGGTPIGPSFLVAARPPTAPSFPQAEFDPLGNLYVAWGEAGQDRDPLQARGYDPGGRPLGPAFWFSSDFSSALAAAVRPDGRLINAWTNDNEVRANVVALCTPPYHTGCGDGVVSAPCESCDQAGANSDTMPDACRTICRLASCGDGVVDGGEQCDDGNSFGCDGCDTACHLEPGYVCGDGVLFPPCGEECDDGAANSDTLPDACRSSCRLPSCGDDVIDAGEPCDDGNLESCDGCSSTCVAEPGLICGDGIPELACDEQCDDGNLIDGDGCTDPCRLERIPGGGSPRSDCLVEWSINNPSNDPRYDQRGAINGAQHCVDGDPACDFDGSVNGSCSFALRVCANNTDIEDCSPPTRLASWELVTPSAKKAATDPVVAAVRAALATVPGAIVGPTARDVCTNVIQVNVPVRPNGREGRLVLKGRAQSYENDKDSDKLKLICGPATS